MRATRHRPLNANQRIYREDCSTHNGGWRYEAFRTNGRYKVPCNSEPYSWRFNFGGRPDVYNRGHLVPCGLGKRIGLAMGAATFNMYNAGPQLVEVNEALERMEANLIDYATKTCLDTNVITGNIVRDFYFISGTVPNKVGPNRKWINREGAWSWEDNWAPSKGSYVPAFVWTPGCCSLTFPDHGNKKVAIRVSYYIKNEPGYRGKYLDLPDLERNMNVVYHTYFGRDRVFIGNLFGGRNVACGKPYNYQDSFDVLVQHYDGDFGNVQELNKKVKEVIEDLRPKYPFISDFPKAPYQQKEHFERKRLNEVTRCI